MGRKWRLTSRTGSLFGIGTTSACFQDCGRPPSRYDLLSIDAMGIVQKYQHFLSRPNQRCHPVPLIYLNLVLVSFWKSEFPRLENPAHFQPHSLCSWPRLITYIYLQGKYQFFHCLCFVNFAFKYKFIHRMCHHVTSFRREQNLLSRVATAEILH